MNPVSVRHPVSSTPSTNRELGRYAAGEGATLVIIGGVHGNEPAGIHAAKRVFDWLGQNRPSAFNGTFVAMAGNLAALVAPPGTRYLDRDLNRSFTPDLLSTPATHCVECREARELIAAIRAERCDQQSLYVIDIHTTSAPSPPFIVIEDSLVARRFAQGIGPAMLLGFEEEIDGLLFDYLTQSLGCVSCVIEGGQHDDPASVDVLEAAIWRSLDAAGILMLDESPGDPQRVISQASGARKGRVFDLRHREPISDPSFEMNDGVDVHTPVRAGQAIATQDGRSVVAPVRGQVFLPNRQPIKRVGDDAFFIVREISPGWLDLSARCRRSAWLASAIARLPGVHSCPDDRGAFFVDAKIAAVLKRQVFHLLGYRILRRGDAVGVPGFRPWGAIRGFLSAAWHRRKPVDRNDARFWLVARRRLDR